jgi:hypothetical protein
MIRKNESKRLRLESQDDEAYVAGKRKPKEIGIEIPNFKREVKPFLPAPQTTRQAGKEEEVRKDGREK